MQLTQFTDLGLRVVMRLAVLDADASPSTRVIAEQLNVSYSHATKVVTQLGELGIVTTRRGRGGGLSITKPARPPPIGWLARRLEGSGEVVDCEGDKPCPLRGGCLLRSALRDAQEAFFVSLDAVMIDDVISHPAKTVLLRPTARSDEAS